MDIPQGTIPLKSFENTQILNIVLEPYVSKSYERYFYGPEEGTFSIYPNNACRGNSIISRADCPSNITFKRFLTTNKLESFTDILRQGDKSTIVDFVRNKNIFDRNVFKPNQILWMLKDKEFYSDLITIFKEKKYYDELIWNFAFYHGDFALIKEIVALRNAKKPASPPLFEYYPYYSSRAHLFASQSKSTIRNV